VSKLAVNASRRYGASLEEIERIYRERFAEYLQLAATVSGDRDGAWDVVQTAFANAVANRQRFRGDAPVEAWLRRAVVRTALNRRRSSARAAAAVHRLSAGPATADRAVGPGRLGRAICALSRRQRAAVFLRYYADLDYAGIASVLGVKRGTVSALLHTAHTSIRRSLDEAGR
jgi:RNA polymerase sigma factor (sigma-70 family)